MSSRTNSPSFFSALFKPMRRGMVESIRSDSSASWMRVREHKALDLFHSAAARVPAYRDFLTKHHINPDEIRSWDDFQKVPAMSKANYLREYPREQLCWDGNLARPAVFSSTSGSTGKPFYFQRVPNLEEEYANLIELYVENGKMLPSAACPTLVIIGFGMGVWIGGTLTFRAYDIVSRRKYPLSILPAGVNKDEIMKALRDLAPSFKQTILIGYPPFVKDILDEADYEGIDLKALNLRLQFAAEAFSERFRDYLAEKAGIKNVYRDTLNVYGTADIGAQAFETPTSILVRRIAMEHPELFARLFGGTNKTPTLAQYNPAYMAFEAPDGEILLSGDSAYPLIRYAVGDKGGVYSYEEVNAILKEHGIDLAAEATKRDVPLYQLPFVYVYERSDLSTTIYGLQIYPEYLKDLMIRDEMQRYCTGKFQIATKYDENQDQYLEINIEQKVGVTDIPKDFVRNLTAAIDTAFKEKSSEYRELSKFVHHRPLYKLVFHPLGDPECFPSGIKQKWVIQEKK